MRLTTKGRYAVTAMLDLAIHQARGPVCLADIAKRQEISLSYLEQLFAKLRKSELVQSIRGPGGGYQLNRDQYAISVSEIVDAVNESYELMACQGRGDCQKGEVCLTHHLWNDLSEQIHGFLSAISIGQLMERADVVDVSNRQDARESAGLKIHLRPVG